MAITVTLPVSAPTGLTATLVAGGTLAVSTTYYYIVIAFNSNNTSPSTSNYPFHSPISAEGSFTTDAVNRSVLINWTNPVEHTTATRYQILLTTVSGEYFNSGGYAGVGWEVVGTIASGVTGYTITALSVDTSAKHSIQLKNDFVGGIDKSLGILKVGLDGAGSYTLDNIYTAIVSAGFSNYVSYDGYTFIFKGYFIGEGTGSGNLIIERKSLIFLRGGVINGNVNFIMRFGRNVDAITGANYNYGCTIDIQNCRYPFCSAYPNIEVYGCMLSSVASLKTTYTEPRYTLYYNGGAQTSLAFNITNFKDNILGVLCRGITSNIFDLKFGSENNFANSNHVRLKIWRTSNLPYFAGGKFYACEWSASTRLNHYVFNATTQYWSDFYDCNFPYFTDNIALCSYTNLSVNKIGLSYTNFNYTLGFSVVDLDGNAISGANINVKDKDGNDITWIEYDTTYDKIITGNTYTTDRTTDVNGLAGYYVNSYKTELNPLNTTGPTSTDIIYTYKYPFTITVSKTGYETQTIILETLVRKTDLIIALKPIVPIRLLAGDGVAVALQAELGSSSLLKKV